MRTRTQKTKKTAEAHERTALARLCLRGAAPAQRWRDPGRVDTEAYNAAAGHLRAALAMRNNGETPDQQCRRLGITGYARRALIPQGCGGRYRLNAKQTAASYRKRGAPGRGVSNAVLDQRRADALGVTLGSPEWQRIIDKDRALFARLKRMRAAAKPNTDENGRSTLKRKR